MAGRGRRRLVALGVSAALAGFVAPSAQAQSGAEPGEYSDFEAVGSVQQVYVTGAEPGADARLIYPGGSKVAVASVNDLGGVLFRKVKAADGYRVKIKGAGRSDPLEVLSKSPAPPDDSIYDQELPDKGYGYLETRDGTELAIAVRPPGDILEVFGVPAPPPGTPTPTLIEYSGYGYADPSGPESGISVLANLMGFTVVDVNMRGTGCSGGAYDFFEPLQSLDGYDVVETVARQDWVKNDQVGMYGISYGGISQLFTAQTNPPSLAAITPISVLDGTQTTLYPGGVLNTGFAVEWAKDRIDDALPAGPDQGQGWAYERIQEGDETCEANQTLHPEAVNLLKKIRSNRTYKPKIADPLTPATFVDEIEVPTFMACQWQDEQTGGHCANLADRFTGTDRKWFTFTNGAHIDSLDPETFNRLYDFLKIYVAEEAPNTNSAVINAAAPVIYQQAMGINGVTLPPDPIQAQPTLAAAKSAFEALPQVRVLYENGGGERGAGYPYPSFEQSFDAFPVPGTMAKTWFAGEDGALTDAAPQAKSEASFEADPRSTAPTNFTGDTGSGDLWTESPSYDWQPHPDGNAASWMTEPLSEDTVVTGAGAVKLWVRSDAPNVDLQATISEVRPDNKEVFVQSGWVRTSMRKLDREQSTKLEPVLSLRKRDVKPMPTDRFVKVIVPLYYQGHPYRAGSRIRVTVSGVNGDQPVWAFAKAKPREGSTGVEISSSKAKPSKLILPVVGGVDVPDALPPCPGLRGQPCRDFGG